MILRVRLTARFAGRWGRVNCNWFHIIGNLVCYPQGLTLPSRLNFEWDSR